MVKRNCKIWLAFFRKRVSSCNKSNGQFFLYNHKSGKSATTTLNRHLPLKNFYLGFFLFCPQNFRAIVTPKKNLRIFFQHNSISSVQKVCIVGVSIFMFRHMKKVLNWCNRPDLWNSYIFVRRHILNIILLVEAAVAVGTRVARLGEFLLTY
jgi:hypothetical protein